MNRIITSLFCLLSIFLASCSSVNPNHINSPYCNSLNSQIVFNGATTNTRQAEIENAQQALAQRNYDNNCTLR